MKHIYYGLEKNILRIEFPLDHIGYSMRNNINSNLNRKKRNLGLYITKLKSEEWKDYLNPIYYTVKNDIFIFEKDQEYVCSVKDEILDEMERKGRIHKTTYDPIKDVMHCYTTIVTIKEDVTHKLEEKRREIIERSEKEIEIVELKLKEFEENKARKIEEAEKLLVQPKKGFRYFLKKFF